MSNPTLRPATPADAFECGRICYQAFAELGRQHRFPPDFPTIQAATDVWSGLIAHPNIFVVLAERDGKILGCNALDERSTIVKVGPLAVDPEAGGHRLGRVLMHAVLDRSADHHALGVRLMQAAFNNRSMSLYATLGFDVRAPFAVMQGDPPTVQLQGRVVRPAARADLTFCDELCMAVHGHDRNGELRDAVDAGIARVVVRDGRITGYTSSVGFNGHAVAERNEDIAALIGAAENFPGPGFLIPLRNTELLRWCLRHGLRITFMMNLMTRGWYQEPRGAFLSSVGY
jgi:predicted N-acetyltransferase YhbS